MGSAQDLRRQLRYSTSRRTTNSKNGRGPHYNQISNQVDSKNPHHAHAIITTPSSTNPNAAISKKTRTKTTNINPASSLFPNTASRINLPNNSTHSHMSVASSRAPVSVASASNPHHRSTSSSRPYIPPPPSRRNYQTREADRASQHSNYRQYNTVPRSSSVARSTTSNRSSRDHRGGSIRPGPRAVSPYRSLTLPDEPEPNRVFPNSDPYQVTDIKVPIPSGYVNSKTSASNVRSNAGPGNRTRASNVPVSSSSAAARSGSTSGYRRPPSQAAASTTSRNDPPQHQPRPHPNSRPRSSSRLPFIPPNGIHPVAALPNPLTRSPSRPRSSSRNTHIQPPAHGDTSPSSATADSNAGPSVREGRALPGLTSRVEPVVSQSRNVSQARGRSPSLRPVQHASQTRNYSTSRARGMDHHPPPSISGSSAMPAPVPIPVPTPIAYSQGLPPHATTTTTPRDPKSRQPIAFPNIGRNRMRQFGNYIPYPKKFRQNRSQAQDVHIQPQDARFGQEHYQTRPINDGRSRDLLAANGSTVEIPRPHDRSSPAAITRSPSRHPNPRSRSASRQSRHSKRSQQSRHSHTNRSVHDTRAPAAEVRFEGDQGIKNTRSNKASKWKWPTSGFGMGKLLNLNSGGGARVEARVIPHEVGTVQVVQDTGHKRIRTNSNSSANWQFPQIKNFTVFKAPIRESPGHSELPSRPILHSLLRVPTLFRPARLNWDVRNQALPVMSNADTAIMQRLLKEPATSPPTTRMLLLVRSPAPKRAGVKSSHSNPKFWEVDVFPSSSKNHPQPYIRCMDVLRAFGKMLRTPADPSEFDSLDDMHRSLVIRAFEMRAAGIFGHHGNDSKDLEHEKAREMRKGYRKVDLLVNQTRWDGLKSTGSRSSEWIVELGRVPFNPYKTINHASIFK